MVTTIKEALLGPVYLAFPETEPNEFETKAGHGAFTYIGSFSLSYLSTNIDKIGEKVNLDQRTSLNEFKTKRVMASFGQR